MKNKVIALIAIPTMILMGSLTTLNADDTTTKQVGQEEQHEGKGKHRGPNLEKKLEKLSKKLELTEAQERQLKAQFEKQSTARKAASTDRKALHQAIKALDPKNADYVEKLAIVKQQASLQAGNKIDSMLASKQEMQAILTPEQFKKFEEMKEKKGAKRGNKSKGKHKEKNDQS